ncbi:hypothetical protein MXZ33_09175 [Streptococcus uberis]|nr:hypothetical protein [Streptococcus uberis]MCK1200903.1 hypothetical protein [Streptococcus uberis]MCK1205767.1 hypothetical protein [Streptococcus uberis]
MGNGLDFLGQKIEKQNRTVTLIFFVMVTFLAISTGKFLMAKMTFGMDFLEEAMSSSLIGKGLTAFLRYSYGRQQEFSFERRV